MNDQIAAWILIIGSIAWLFVDLYRASKRGWSDAALTMRQGDALLEENSGTVPPAE